MSNVGRNPIILTDELREEILEQLERGIPVRIICDKIGVSVGPFYRWQEEYPEFLEACQRARQVALKRLKSEAEACVASKLEARESDSWKAASWFLSHKHPSEYAERRIQENTGEPSPFDRLADVLAQLHERESE